MLVLGNGVHPADLVAVASTGGGARIPIITTTLSERFRVPVITTPRPGLAAASGAALRAATMAAPVFADADAQSTTFRPLAWSERTTCHLLLCPLRRCRRSLAYSTPRTASSRMRRAVLVVSSVLLFVSIAGGIVSLVLNAFVLDDYDAYGEMPIPGSQTLALPAGEVTVSFHTQVIGGTSGAGLPVPALGMEITAPEGVTKPEFTENVGSTTTVNNDAHVRVGILHVEKAADYSIQTHGTVTAYVSPRLSFGHGSAYGFLPWVFAVLGGASLLILLGTIFLWRRTPRPVLTVDPTFSISSIPADPYIPTDQGIRLEQLKTLASLRESGALTQEEFEAEKRRILGQ